MKSNLYENNYCQRHAQVVLKMNKFSINYFGNEKGSMRPPGIELTTGLSLLFKKYLRNSFVMTGIDRFICILVKE